MQLHFRHLPLFSQSYFFLSLASARSLDSEGIYNLGESTPGNTFFFFNFWCILDVTISVNFAFSLKNAREERKLLQRGDSWIQNLEKELTDNWDSQYQVTKYVGCAKTRRKIKSSGGTHAKEGK